MKKLFILVCILFIACKKELPKVEKVKKAFYYWKTNSWSMEKEEENMLRHEEISKLYVKFFEVSHNDFDGNIPVSKSSLHITEKQPYTIVPTVYIRNEVFKKSNDQDIKKLADNIYFLINKKIKDYYRNAFVLDEIQIDCDWTPSTKEAYFSFLKALKTQVNKQQKISCTLRLYPYKYPNKMGVPPVDKAMLMCYNLINPLSDKNKNSILDIGALKKYLVRNKKYPIHLDVALPLYSWMQVFQNNTFTKVIYKDFDKIKSVLTPIKPLWFEVVKDTTVADMYFRVGDKIKYDEISKKTIEEAITVIKNNVELDKEITLSFFHLDNEQLKHFSNEKITDLYTLISQ